MSKPTNNSCVLEAAAHNDIQQVAQWIAATHQPWWQRPLRRMFPWSRTAQQWRVRQTKTGAILNAAAHHGHKDVVAMVLPLRPPTLTLALRAAANRGHKECVEMLLPHVHTHPLWQDDACTFAVWEAVQHRHGHIVELFLPSKIPQKDIAFALNMAASRGFEEIVALLMPHCNPKSDESQALFEAAANGHAKCVRLLLPVSEPSAQSNRAIVSALKNNHDECVELLYKLCDIKNVLQMMHAKDQATASAVLQTAVAKHDKKILATQTATTIQQAPSHARRKM